MTLDEQAQALADWLEQNPESPPPEGVDEDVLQAIYVFRPDLAPPANVSVDDILARVESGPFSQSMPLQASGAKPSSVPKESLASRRHRRRFWSGAGALAAAAAVLIIALPQQKDAAQIGPQMQPQHAMEPPSAPHSESISAVEKVEKAKVTKEKRELSDQEKKDFGVGDMDGGAGKISENAAGGMSGTFGEAAALMEDEEPIEAEEEELEATEGLLDFIDPNMDADPSSGLSLGSGSKTEIDFEGVGVEGELVKPQGGLLLDRKRAPASAAAEEEMASKSDSESRSRGRLFQRKSRAENAPPAPEPSAAPQADEATGEATLEKNTAALASLAIPADYLPPPNNLPSTNQWRVAENARLALKENRFDDAQSIAATGLSLSAENTPQLSMLHYVLGRCASQAGRESEANASFEKAIALNTQRQ
jgi:hypothetical protein